MAKIDVIDILKAKKMSPMEFNFDSLWLPPMQCYLLPQDVEALRQIATSIRLSAKIEQKYSMIDQIMKARGFRRFSGGTNRVIYSHLEDPRFVAKIAVDKVGMQDNPMEYKNQFLLKPYVAKTFYTSPCGTVGFAERVLPIKKAAEFKEIAGDVFDIIVYKILGKYVVEDVGTKFFMNWGIRAGCSPVLLDYPYIFKLDGRKLYCNNVAPDTGIPCNGEIDYDPGFNHLVCTKCGKMFLARDLQDDSIENKIIIKGGTHMKVVIREGGKIVSAPIPSEEVMRPAHRHHAHANGIVVAVKDETGTRVLNASMKKEFMSDGISTTDTMALYAKAKHDQAAESEEKEESVPKQESDPVEEPLKEEEPANESEPAEVADPVPEDQPSDKAEENEEQVASDQHEEPVADPVKEEVADCDVEGDSAPTENNQQPAPQIPRVSTKSNKSKKVGGPKIGSTFIPTPDQGEQ